MRDENAEPTSQGPSISALGVKGVGESQQFGARPVISAHAARHMGEGFRLWLLTEPAGRYPFPS